MAFGSVCNKLLRCADKQYIYSQGVNSACEHICRAACVSLFLVFCMAVQKFMGIHGDSELLN